MNQLVQDHGGLPSSSPPMLCWALFAVRGGAQDLIVVTCWQEKNDLVKHRDMLQGQAGFGCRVLVLMQNASTCSISSSSF